MALFVRWPGVGGLSCGLVGLLAAGPLAAQQSVATDSTVSPLAAPALHRRVGFVVSLDNRDSFIQASAVHTIGLNAGVVLLNHRWRLGLGGYTLRHSYADLYIHQYKNGKRTNKIASTLTPQLSLAYLTPNVSYVFIRRRWLEVSVPIEIGLGRSHYTQTDQHGNLHLDSRGLFVPVEAGLAVLIKPVRWMGVSGSLGYRKSVFEVDYQEDFDGMYFSYRLNVFAGALWHDWRQHRQHRLWLKQADTCR